MRGIKGKYVCDAYTPTWLGRRKLVLTGSEIAQAKGEARYGTREDLIHAKLAKNQAPILDNTRMWWGREMERPNLRAFRKAFGIPARASNAYYECGNLGATTDGFAAVPRCAYRGDYPDRKKVLALREDIASRSGLGVLELKNTEWRTVRGWGESYPPQYEYQVQAQMLCTGLTWGLLVAKVGASEMRWWLIDEDEDLQREIIALADSFVEDMNEWR